jgi:succinate dehydrogenase / fumarate reductase cytochrome b subunit
MHWLLRIFISSLGKKLVMAITGLCFCLFLFVHLLGNLTIYGGNSMFNAYAGHLQSFGPLLNAVEIGLVLLALLHISFGLLLFIENIRARPIRYAVKKNAGGRTWSSSIMPYTGLYLFAFILIHLLSFRFIGSSTRTVSELVAAAFTIKGYVAFYVFSVIVAALHVRHGFWSAFQTVGLNHPKYFPLIQGASLLFSFALGIGFASIPIFVLYTRV